VLATAQFGQVLLLLLGSAVLGELIDTQIGVGSIGKGHASSSPGIYGLCRSLQTCDEGQLGLPRELLHDDAVVQIAAPSASKIWLRRDAQKAKITQFLPEGSHVPMK